MSNERTAELNGWKVANNGPDNDYLYITLDGCSGQIVIKKEDEGFVIDIWSDDEDASESVATTFAAWTDLERE